VIRREGLTAAVPHGAAALVRETQAQGAVAVERTPAYLALPGARAQVGGGERRAEGPMGRSSSRNRS